MADFLSSSGSGDIDFDAAASAFPDISLDGDFPIPTQPTPAVNRNNSNSGFSFDDFERNSPPTEVKVTGDEDIEKFENEFPDIDVGETPSAFSPPQLQQQPSYGSSMPFAPQPQPSNYTSTPMLSHTIEEEEPQVIKDWREAQAVEIKNRDEAAKAKRQEIISKAERSIDEFYEEYSTKKERSIRENKDEEAAYIATLSSSLSSGTTWERICELVELQNSQSKTIARTGAGTTDLARMKEVLLRLKREGDKAPGAGGY